MSINFICKFCTIYLCLFSLLVNTVGTTEAQQQVTLAHNFDQGSTLDLMLKEFADKIEKENVDLKFSIIPSEQLRSMDEIEKFMRSNTFDIALIPLQALRDQVPDLKIFDLVFMFPNLRAVSAFQDSTGGQDILGEIISTTGLKPLGYVHSGMLQFAANVPIRDPDDLDDRKVRTFRDDLINEQLASLGANPIQLSFNEVYSGLQTGYFDTATSTTDGLVSGKWNEVAPVLTAANYAYLGYVLTVNPSFWDSLDSNTRSLIETMADTTINEYNYGVIKSELTTQELLNFTQLQIEDRMAWVNESESVWNKHAYDINPDTLQIAMAISRNYEPVPYMVSFSDPGSGGSDSGGGSDGTNVENPKEIKLLDFRYNAWFENTDDNNDNVPSFSRIKILEANNNETRSYRLFLDLSAFEYADQLSGNFSAELDPEITGILDDVLNTDQKDLHLDVVAIPDPTVFKTTGPLHPEALNINLEKIRTILNGGMNKPKDVFADLKAKSDMDVEIPYVFSRVRFNLEIASNLGMENDKALNTSVTFVFSRNNRPLGELIVPVCIGLEGTHVNRCSIDEPRFSFSGNDAVQLAGENPGGTPDAALHLVESGNVIVTVLRIMDNNGDVKIYHWPLFAEDKDKVEEILRTTVVDLAKYAPADDEAFGEIGDKLWSFLFPVDQLMPKGYFTDIKNDAKAALMNFFSTAPTPSNEDGAVPEKVLFVRMVQNIRKNPLFIPIGFVPIKENDKVVDFAGFRVRVEYALFNQSYSPTNSCINRWVSAFPESNSQDDELKKVAQAMDQGTRHLFTNISMLDWHKTIKSVVDWFKVEEQEQSPLAFMAISHHGENILRFDDPGQSMTTQDARRKFKAPSVAVLNGCGTGQVGATGIIHRLNLSDIHSFIVTNTSVRPETAADFTSCFANSLETADSQNDYNLSNAYFDTIRCLKDGKSGSAVKHGPRALKYILLGNGNARVCRPKR